MHAGLDAARINDVTYVKSCTCPGHATLEIIHFGCCIQDARCCYAKILSHTAVPMQI